MAKRTPGVPRISISVDMPPDGRPHGAVMFCDPSTAEMTERFHNSKTLGGQNESGGDSPYSKGIRSIDARGARWGMGHELLEKMNMKRGVTDEGDND